MESNDMLTFIGSISDWFLVILAVLTIWLSVKEYKKQKHITYYNELDKIYIEILKIAIDKPFLRDLEQIKFAFSGNEDKQIQKDKQIQYDSYAYIVWNYLETIYDYTTEHMDCADVDKLIKTWYPVIEAEYRLHRDWFHEKHNCHKFKEEFVGWVARYDKKSG